jgi:hypothetical protein
MLHEIQDAFPALNRVMRELWEGIEVDVRFVRFLLSKHNSCLLLASPNKDQNAQEARKRAQGEDNHAPENHSPSDVPPDSAEASGRPAAHDRRRFDGAGRDGKTEESRE